MGTTLCGRCCGTATDRSEIDLAIQPQRLGTDLHRVAGQLELENELEIPDENKSGCFSSSQPTLDVNVLGSPRQQQSRTDSEGAIYHVLAEDTLELEWATLSSHSFQLFKSKFASMFNAQPRQVIYMETVKFISIYEEGSITYLQFHLEDATSQSVQPLSHSPKHCAPAHSLDFSQTSLADSHLFALTEASQVTFWVNAFAGITKLVRLNELC